MRRSSRCGRRAGSLAVGLALGSALLVGVLVAPSGAVTVSNEAALRSAFDDPNQTRIDLDADITLTDCSVNFGEVTRNNPNVALTLDGHGHTVRQTCPIGGVFGQYGDYPLTFQNVTITGGNQDNTTTCYGGGIRTSAPLTVIDSWIVGNRAPCAGGGISVGSSLSITSSTISGNTTDGEGGGIFQSSGGQPFTLTNSTVSGNETTSDNAGGGIRAFGDLVMVYSTVINNTAINEANLSGYSEGPATLTSFGSVVALPLGGGANCAGFVTFTSEGYNWDDDGSCQFNSTGDHSNAGDPQLGPLGDNGGPTPTHLPSPGSPLIDAIPNDACQSDGASGITTDQRHLQRPEQAGGSCDIGSVEVQLAELEGDVTVIKRVVGTPPPGTTFRVEVDCDGGQDDKALTFGEAGGTKTFERETSEPLECEVTETASGGATSVDIACDADENAECDDHNSFTLFDDPDGVDSRVTITVTNTFPVVPLVIAPTFTG